MAIATLSSHLSIANDFLHLASEAVRNEQSSEGALRTAISRGYYAVFLTVRDQLFGPDGIRLTNPARKKLRKKFRKRNKQDAGSHDLIIFAITDVRRSLTLNPLIFSQQVAELKEARIHADYHFTPGNLASIPHNNWREYAEESLDLASQLLPVAKNLPGYPVSVFSP